MAVIYLRSILDCLAFVLILVEYTNVVKISCSLDILYGLGPV